MYSQQLLSLHDKILYKIFENLLNFLMHNNFFLTSIDSPLNSTKITNFFFSYTDCCD